ncbi:MAG TPA: caspase family protein [Pyrinomonadaceae bacterium]|nr:caspase family protein [Pyrinomonadaceae bacterium]
MPRGISVHVGVNNPDPVFGVTPLQGCVSDATSMRDIAVSRGFEAKIFLDGNATFENVFEAILDATEQLTADDIFLFTFAGHGSFQSTIPSDEEADGQDETILLRDCVLIDNFLRRNLWSQFAEGVRILGVADSCHSGSVLSASHVGPSPGIPSANAPSPALIMDGGGGPELATTFGTVVVEAAPPRPVSPSSTLVRAFTDADRGRIERLNPELHARLRSELLSGEDANVRASLLTLSACRDNQDALDGPEHGAFTQALLDVWNGGTFTGNYDDFIAGISGRFTPAQQSPNRRPELVDNAFLQQHPFTI